MKGLILSIILVMTSTAALAQDPGKIIREDKRTISALIKEIQQLQKEQDLNTANTCMDEVLQRRRALHRRNWTAPLKGLGWTVGSMGSLTLGFLILAGGNAWGILFGIILGISYGGIIGAGTYIGIQTYDIIKARQLTRSARIITQARLGSGKRLERFMKRVSKNVTNWKGEESEKQVKALLYQADASGSYCNASLRTANKQEKYKNSGELKHAIATYRDLKRYVTTELNK